MLIPVSGKTTLLSFEPWPCYPVAETVLQPLIWFPERLSYQGPYSPEERFFFPQTWYNRICYDTSA